MSSLRTPGPVRVPLPRDRLAAPAATVARRLLGALLVRAEADGGETLVRIVETEAYRQSDPASHSFRGRTARTAAMFGPPGRAYVYFTYGMHHCLNVVCEPDGVGAAVLLRAAVPLVGIAHVRRRRGSRPDRELLSGPGRLTSALGVDRSADRVDLLAADSPLRLETDGWVPAAATVLSGPRVGVRAAADVPWRFWLDDVGEVSRYARHRHAPSPEQSAGRGRAPAD